MGNIEKFYENTKNGMPHDNIKKFMLNPSKVIKSFYHQTPVYYELECDNLRSFFNENQIDYHSKNKEDVEDFIIAKKYNL